MNYHDIWGRFPYGAIGHDPVTGNYPTVNDNRQPFCVAVLPYIEAGTLFNAYNLAYQFETVQNLTVRGTQIAVWNCPSEARRRSSPKAPPTTT